MMAQFRTIKEQYPDALLLFRCGDFYETYCEDAVRASKILNITLTHRSNGAAGTAPIDMAGFPFHALDTYLPKLVREGLRVAICDQLEDPKLTKTLVKRGVTELVTPGASYSDTTLQQKQNTFLACLHFSPTAKRSTLPPYSSTPLPLSSPSGGGREGAPIAVVLGHEVFGVQQEVVDACDGCIEIKQYGTKHSLNVSVTAGIVMHEIATWMRNE